jgi:hypothetical protein
VSPSPWRPTWRGPSGKLTLRSVDARHHTQILSMFTGEVIAGGTPAWHLKHVKIGEHQMHSRGSGSDIPNPHTPRNHVVNGNLLSAILRLQSKKKKERKKVRYR